MSNPWDTAAFVIEVMDGMRSAGFLGLETQDHPVPRKGARVFKSEAEAAALVLPVEESMGLYDEQYAVVRGLIPLLQ